MMSDAGNPLINFSGSTHDHNGLAYGSDTRDQSGKAANSCSTIAILKQHPMYDCLVLVKKYRSCFGGYALEFPLDIIHNENSDANDENKRTDNLDTSNSRANCSGRKLVSKFLDGDDPVHHPCWSSDNNGVAQVRPEVAVSDATSVLDSPFPSQVDDKGDICELVHVPINGLLDRLEGYTRAGIAVDSCVYAFAMGLKTAERILTTNSMKELQETPI